MNKKQKNQLAMHFLGDIQPTWKSWYTANRNVIDRVLDEQIDKKNKIEESKMHILQYLNLPIYQELDDDITVLKNLLDKIDDIYLTIEKITKKEKQK